MKIIKTGGIKRRTICQLKRQRALEFTLGSGKIIPGFENAVIGQQLQIPQEDGKPLKVTISDMNEDTVTLDANHPLAGRALTFNILLVAIT